MANSLIRRMLPGALRQRLKLLITDLRLARWRRRNPGASYAKFYADRITAKTRRGVAHTTLGTHGREAGRGAEVAWDRASFERRGLGNWADIVALGLAPGMRCVDYGCGSLRLGQHAIRFLDRGHYWGIDVTDEFYRVGLSLIDPALIEDKAPRTGVIAPPLLRDIRAWRPDFIFSNAVLQHVPADELAAYFARLEAMMSPGSTVFILFITGEQAERFDSMSWSYPVAQVRAAAIEGAPALMIDGEVVEQGARGDGQRRVAMRLRWPAAAD